MRTCYSRSATIVAGAALLLLAVPGCVFAQSDTKPPGMVAVEKAAAALAPAGWTVPKMPDGHPDLQGYYTNISTTPLERPRNMADKPFFTEAEAAAFTVESKAKAQASRAFGEELFIDSGDRVAVTMQSSLVVDPPDGRIPPYTPEARKRLAAEQGELKAKCADPTRVCPPGYDGKTPALADKPSDFSLMERCIKWQTAGPPMLPAIYDSNYHIVQTSKYVMIQVEGGRDVRIIPVDGTPHVPPTIRLWLGDSRGHWEGNSLIVDTTNFSDETDFRGSDRNLHVIERFTRVSPNVILYEFTIDDPTTFTQPWSGVIPMRAMKGPIFEYACNEGNYALADIMRGARRYEEQKAAALKNRPSNRIPDSGSQ